MRKFAISLAWVAALASVGCSNDSLSVSNQTQPDVERVYGSLDLIEQAVGTSYAQVFSGLHGSATSLTPQVQTLALENYGTVANYGMNVREGIPRRPITNEPNNVTYAENFRDFDYMQRKARDAATAIVKQDSLLAQPGKVTSQSNLRTRAFSWFSLGIAQGSVAMMYDSAAIITPGSEATPPLSGASEVNVAALAALDSAIAVASTAPSGFPLPATWTNNANGKAMSLDDFIRLARSYKAIFRAGVARTPAERAAVDWQAVIADAVAGDTADYVVTISSNLGWSLGWEGSQMFASNSGGWHQMPMYIIGMADTSGAFTTWAQTEVGRRQAFLIRTPDRRFPAGETRAAQQALTPSTTKGNIVEYKWVYTSYPYLRNRDIADTPAGDDFGNSFYDFYRFKGINQGSGVGPWINIAKVEIDMLAAEGYCRTNQPALAAALIDKSRVKAGLPALSGVVTDCVVGTSSAPAAGQPVPGGTACVPRIIVNNNTTKCGDMWEAMKWEKRMETAYTGYLTWYLDSRGWGDLPQNTALQFPIPYQELQARRLTLYGAFGGSGNPSSAALGTYGY